jgi:hypothetical protein
MELLEAVNDNLRRSIPRERSQSTGWQSALSLGQPKQLDRAVA